MDMKVRWSVVAVAVVGTIVGFVLEGNGPVGGLIWPPSEGPDPEGVNLIALILMGVIEALAFGLGVTFLVFGWPLVSRVTTNRGYATGVFLSIAWVLVNWVPHTALHMNHGNILTPADFGGLVAIEYGFHFTLIIAACFMAHFFLRAVRMMAGMSAPAATPAPSARPKKA